LGVVSVEEMDAVDYDVVSARTLQHGQRGCALGTGLLMSSGSGTAAEASSGAVPEIRRLAPRWTLPA
jgi:hypothetical protein